MSTLSSTQPVRRRLLVADDDDSLRVPFCRLLRRHHDVESVNDGALVLQLVEAGASFDAILMDLEMPIMNGKRALEALAAIAPALAGRTLVITGGTADPRLSAWLGSLPRERLHYKPVDLPRLLASIELVQGAAL